MPRSRFCFAAAAIGALALAAFAIAPSRAAEEAVIIPAPAVDATAADGIETAALAGGCFWGVQGGSSTPQAWSMPSGYSGGTKATADYNTASAGTTGHAEAVEVKYDPKKISYGKTPADFFRSCTTRPSSTARVPTSAIAWRSSLPMTSRRRWRRPRSWS